MTLVELLRAFGASDDLIALAERWTARQVADDGAVTMPDGVEALTDDELTEFLAGLIQLGEDDSVGLGLVEMAADTAVEVRTEQAARTEAAEAEEAALEQQRARLRGEEPAASDPDPDDPPNPDDPPADPDAPPADPDAPPADVTPEPVTASTRADLQSLARRQSRQARPDVEDTTPHATLRFAANVRGVPANHDGRPDRRSMAQLSAAMQETIDSLRRAGNGLAEIRLATLTAAYPEDRRLVDDEGHALAPSAMGRIVGRVLERHGNPEAITAAGGLCAPLQPYYGVEVIGDDRRPIRDEALVGFEAPRGGLISMTPPILPQLSGSIGIWDMDMDAAAVDDENVKKVKMRVECGETETTVIKAITARLVVGNMIAKTYGEWVQGWSDLQLVAQARVADTELWDQIVAKTSALTPTATTEVSATRDTLNRISRVAAVVRSRHRVLRSFPFRVILPELFLDIAVEDISKGLPAGMGWDEVLAITTAKIEGWFRNRNLNPTFSPDLAVQGGLAASGPFPELPSTIDFAVYPEGALLHLGSPDINLGVVRDTNTNDRNDYETFSESFEAVHRLAPKEMTAHGTINVCPSGASNGTLDPSGMCASYT